MVKALSGLLLVASFLCLSGGLAEATEDPDTPDTTVVPVVPPVPVAPVVPVVPPAAEAPVTPAPPSAPAPPPAADDYGADPHRDVGYRNDVCRAERPGRMKLVQFLKAKWPGIQNVWGYACREINQPGSDDCDGEWEPEFSTCWSTHATGRAIDVMVGGGLNDPTPEGLALGDEIVTWLLANHFGIDNYYVRVMGIQQILWNQRCWDAKRGEDRYVLHAFDMRRCGIGNHDNHPHLTLSYAGADGMTIWYQNPVG